MNLWAEWRLNEYREDHRHPTNIFLHFLGIPTIVFSLAIWACAMPYGKYVFPALLFFYACFFNSWRGWVASLGMGLLFMGAYFACNREYQMVAFGLAAAVFLFLTHLVASSNRFRFFRTSRQLDLLLVCELLALGALGFIHGFGENRWLIGAAFFILGWSLQIPGHYGFEGKPPSVTKNLSHLFVAPIWIVDWISDRLFKKKEV